jgi:hypothetical protein
MAVTYMELLGSAAEGALAIPEIWNTPETSVPGAYSTVAMQKAVGKLLNKLGASVPLNGNKNDPKFVAALTLRFGPGYAANYRWREIVEELYADTQAGRMLPMGSTGLLDSIPGPRVSGIPVLPIALGVAAWWYFSKRR